MTRPITTAPADTARAMHAAEMRELDMQDAPERIWAVASLGMVGSGRWVTQGTEKPHGNIGYTRTDLCITEAECQRRIDAAVQAERDVMMEALGLAQYGLSWASAYFRDNNPTHCDEPCPPVTRGLDATSAAIRARGQK